ncbi:MAG: histidine kinase, partial [Elusimicrobia bacterium]|nr:histidine kinase [Elusimicrobiota bacterium]
DLVDATLDEVQKIAMELRPGVLDNLGLTVAIDCELKKFQERTGIHSRLESGEGLDPESPEISTALFRIFQELLTNVIRHAKATEVQVALKKDEGTHWLIVTDNGKGLAQNAASSSKSLGILGVRERAALLGGEATFQGSEGGGTTVRVRIPRREA